MTGRWRQLLARTSRGARAFATVGGAVLLTMGARRFADETMYVFFVAGVQLVASRDGWRLGATALALSILAIDFFFIAPAGSLRVLSAAAAAQLLSFTLVSILLLVVAHALRVARQTSEDLAEAATRARDEAQRMSEARTRFLSTLSHEVRTPLNAMLGYSDLIETVGPVGDEQRKLLQRMRAAARHLLSVVNGVLDLARVEAGHVNLRREEMNLRRAVDTAVAMVAPQADARRVSIALRPEQDGVVCLGDSDRICQILVNLLANAVKFSPAEDRVVVTWGVDRARAGDSAIIVSVRDSGPGIPRQDQERIFVPFEQTTGGAGYRDSAGLGLAISRQLARMNGGDLTVESELARGTTFSLRLPTADRRQPA